jgi:hypothetical protein
MALNRENARAFNASLKKAVIEAIGQKVKVEIVNSYNFPNCWVRVRPETEFDNDFRLRVFDVCNETRDGLRNLEDVSFGNIKSNSISAKVWEWEKLFS